MTVRAAIKPVVRGFFGHSHLMRECIRSNGTVESCNAEHEVYPGTEPANATVLIIVNEHCDNVGSILGSLSMNIVHDAIGRVRDAIQSVPEGVIACRFRVGGITIGVDKAQRSRHATISKRLVCFRNCSVNEAEHIGSCARSRSAANTKPGVHALGSLRPYNHNVEIASIVVNESTMGLVATTSSGRTFQTTKGLREERAGLVERSRDKLAKAAIVVHNSLLLLFERGLGFSFSRIVSSGSADGSVVSFGIGRESTNVSDIHVDDRTIQKLLALAVGSTLDEIGIAVALALPNPLVGLATVTTLDFVALDAASTASELERDRFHIISNLKRCRVDVTLGAVTVLGLDRRRLAVAVSVVAISLAVLVSVSTSIGVAAPGTKAKDARQVPTLCVALRRESEDQDGLNSNRELHDCSVLSVEVQRQKRCSDRQKRCKR